MAVLGMAAMTALAGCNLDRSPIVWTTGVEPPLVCPGDSVTLSYNTAEGGCLGDGCPDPVQVMVAVDGSPISEGLTMHGASNSSTVGPVTGPTTFTFSTTGGRYGGSREPRSHSVDTLIPMAESPVALNVGAECSGDAIVWQPVDLSVPTFRSDSVRLVRVCNTTSEAVSLLVVFGRVSSGGFERTWTLVPGRCTEDLPPDQGSIVSAAWIRPLTPPLGPVSCTTSSSGVPRGLQLQGILTCDLESASAPIVAATAGPTPTPEIVVLPTLTPEPTATESAPPLLTFIQDANCRKGPGSRYDVLTSLTKGTQSPALGRNQASNWWLVQVPQTELRCWVSGVSLEGGGDPGLVPLVDVGPLPGVPGGLAAGKTTCSANLNNYPVELEWNDSSGETGYRLYRNGTLVATLGANANSYADEAPKGTALTYELESFNSLGKSERASLSVPACP
jgi:hypothetical protein